MKALFDLPFIQVALPIVISLFLGVFMQNKRLDEMSKRFDERMSETGKRLDERMNDMSKRLDNLREEVRFGFEKVNGRLDRIEVALHEHDTRLVRLETRAWK